MGVMSTSFMFWSLSRKRSKFLEQNPNLSFKRDFVGVLIFRSKLLESTQGCDRFTLETSSNLREDSRTERNPKKAHNHKETKDSHKIHKRGREVRRRIKNPTRPDLTHILKARWLCVVTATLPQNIKCIDAGVQNIY
jgi:hypothetical protein